MRELLVLFLLTLALVSPSTLPAGLVKQAQIDSLVGSAISRGVSPRDVVAQYGYRFDGDHWVAARER